MQTLQSYTERNTSFVVQKSVVIQVYGACISSGIGILEACRVTGTSMGFSEQVVRRSMLISLAYGRPNLTIQDVVSRLKQTRNVDLFPGNLE